jgi:hypothetical protein
MLPVCPEARAGRAEGAGGVEGWHAALARHWAPAIFQNVEVSDLNPLGRYDLLTSVDFDGDFAGGNNWEDSDDLRRSDFPLAPYVYYAVQETETHYYITYSLFHPRDWTWSALAEARSTSASRGPASSAPDDASAALTHENDLESATLVVAKQGRLGALRLLGTVCHLNNYCFTAASGIVPETWGLDAGGGDAAVRYYENRPCLFVESGGHGIGGINRALAETPGGAYRWGDRRYAFAGGAGVVYLPSDDPGFEPQGEPPAAAGAAGEANVCRYQLLPLISSLWPMRAAVGPGMMFSGTFTYRSPGGCSIAALPVFLAAEGQDEGANPPWARDASGDDLGRGVWFLDPALAFDHYVAAWTDRDLPGFHRYLINPYVAADVRLDVTLPGAGRPVVPGYPVTMRWQAVTGAEGLLDRAEILLSRNGGRTWTTLPIPAILASGEATWAASGPPGKRCLLGLRSPLACESDLAAVDLTDAFSIVGAGVLDWLELPQGASPIAPALAYADAAYDRDEDRMVAVGGKAVDEASGQVWAFDFAEMAWETLSVASPVAPVWRDRPVVVHDADRRRLILWGTEAPAGRNHPGGLGDPGATAEGGIGSSAVWIYSLADHAWSPVAAIGGDCRTGAVGAYDPNSNRLVIFGGAIGDSALNDVRDLDLPVEAASRRDGWSQGRGAHVVSPERAWQTIHNGEGMAPAPRSGAVGVYDAASRRLVVHGGRTRQAAQVGSARRRRQPGPDDQPGEVALADLWAFDLTTGTWTALSDGTAGCPLARWHHVGLLDRERSQMVIYGGQDATRTMSDTWAFDLDGLRWNLLNDGLDRNSPGPRTEVVAALRAPGGQLVVSGGLPAAFTPEATESGIWNVWSMALGRGDTGRPGGEAVVRDTLPILLPTVCPNPARGEVNVSFTLRMPCRVTVAFYDVAGRLVGVLRDADTQAGFHSLRWDGQDAAGRRVSEGVYFCRIMAGDLTRTKPAVLLR